MIQYHIVHRFDIASARMAWNRWLLDGKLGGPQFKLLAEVDWHSECEKLLVATIGQWDPDPTMKRRRDAV